MDNIKIIDGHEFKLFSEGLYKTDTPYEITKDWSHSKEHYDMNVVGPFKDGVMYAEYISINLIGWRNLVDLIDGDWDNRCCMQGMPGENTLGVLLWE